jgi:hypothetical protein
MNFASVTSLWHKGGKLCATRRAKNSARFRYGSGSPKVFLKTGLFLNGEVFLKSVAQSRTAGRIHCLFNACPQLSRRGNPPQRL